MSGGVDSSVAALLLKNKGYDVRGIFLDFFGNENSVKEVREISQKIGISLEIVDASKDFKKKVVDYFLEELESGNTPNPCVVCNKEIKFRVLFEKMFELKADYVATGHYARIKRITNYESRIMNFILFEAKDKNKDQSYFLYRLNQKELSKILFPLGNYTKPEVRKMAKKFGLPVYDKKESQDICFISEKGYEKFLKKMLKLRKGKICDLEDNILGTHAGLPFYTIGQRKGIKIGGRGPFYVTRKDFSKNRLIVGEEKDLFSQKMKLKNINWIGKTPKFPAKTLVRTRYRNSLVNAIISKDNNVVFENPQRAIAPGQSAVFYSGKGEVLGGGVIG
jgi:tRNA-specific 2-thiouridylase